jgi:putative DNA primase/helicase
MEAVKRQREQELQARRAECITKSNGMLKSAKEPDQNHPYLLKKGIQPFGAKQLNDLLLIPLRKNKAVVGLQTITPDGTKRFLIGTEKQGAYHAIPGTGDTVYLCEGWATGCTIHKVTGATVIVCFDCGNLEAAAQEVKAKGPDYSLVIVADNDHKTEGNPGLTKATAAALSVGCKLAVPEFNGADGSDVNDLFSLCGSDVVVDCLQAATMPGQEVTGAVYNELPMLPPEPLPLLRQTPVNEPFPIGTLPPVIRDAVRLVHETVQAPLDLCCQSFLAAAALAVQPHVDVLIDGRRFPVSDFFVAVAQSGERKSAVDRWAVGPIYEQQQIDGEAFHAEALRIEAAKIVWEAKRKSALKEDDRQVIEAMLSDAGAEPKRVQPFLLCSEPSFQGIERAYSEGRYTLGLFSDEGGRFLGGYAMKDTNMTATITGLSKLWDGSPLDRMRGGDGLSVLYNRRFSVHLMLQPVLAGQLFGSNMLTGQGFLSRCLCCWPESTIGTRLYKAVDLSQHPAMLAYSAAMKNILTRPLPLHEQPEMGLHTQPLTLSESAKQVWVQFHNHVEKLQKPGGELQPITGFASKAAEHTARIAGVLTYFKNPDAREIELEELQAAIAVIQFYLGESLRLFHAAGDDPVLILAQECFEYGMCKTGGIIGLRNLYQFGPNAVRSRDKAKEIMTVLEAHHRAVKIDSGATVAGHNNKDAWRLIPMGVL